jgi:hypothetical protein
LIPLSAEEMKELEADNDELRDRLAKIGALLQMPMESK